MGPTILLQPAKSYLAGFMRHGPQSFPADALGTTQRSLVQYILIPRRILIGVGVYEKCGPREQQTILNTKLRILPPVERLAPGFECQNPRIAKGSAALDLGDAFCHSQRLD